MEPKDPQALAPQGLRIFFDRAGVKRIFGPEPVEAAVEADKQRERTERGRKRLRRSLDWGGR